VESSSVGEEEDAPWWSTTAPITASLREAAGRHRLAFEATAVSVTVITALLFMALSLGFQSNGTQQTKAIGTQHDLDQTQHDLAQRPAMQYPASQSPATQSPVSQSPASQSPAGKITRYLADMNPVESYDSNGIAVINGGASYMHSITLNNNFFTRDSSVQYDLGRKWQQFDATVGLTDDSPVGQQIQFQIFADGNKVFDRLIDFGSSVSVRLLVSGVLRLKLETLYSGQAMIVHVGFGDAMLTGDAATVGAD
jgi:NPCBM/NEW2 domain